jgi:hypothetical protein
MKMKKHKTKMITIFIALTILTFAFFNAQPVTGQDEEITRLRQKITELEKRIKDLESLLRISKDPESLHTGEEQGWQNKKNWRNLKTGMTREQVYKMLGEPIMEIDGVRTLWYYPNIYCGYVSFDEKGCLIQWSEP